MNRNSQRPRRHFDGLHLCRFRGSASSELWALPLIAKIPNYVVKISVTAEICAANQQGRAGKDSTLQSTGQSAQCDGSCIVQCGRKDLPSLSLPSRQAQRYHARKRFVGLRLSRANLPRRSAALFAQVLIYIRHGSITLPVTISKAMFVKELEYYDVAIVWSPSLGEVQT